MVSERSSTPATRRASPTSRGQLAAHERLAAGEPDSLDAHAREHAHEPRDLLEASGSRARSSHGSPSAGMQYWQRKLQRSVTETRRSRNGPAVAVDEGSAGRGHAKSVDDARVRPVPFTLLDVFAVRPLEGTLHAVIEEADGIGAETMATLARRLRLPETSFLQRTDSATADYRHRIFTIAGEIPFAGHPSLGAAAVWCRRAGRARADVVQSTGAGEQRLEVVLEGRSGEVAIQQNAPVLGPSSTPGRCSRASACRSTRAIARWRRGWYRRGSPRWSCRSPSTLRCRGSASTGPGSRRPSHRSPMSRRSTATSSPSRPRGDGRRAASRRTSAAVRNWRRAAAGPFGAYLREQTGALHVVVDQGVDLGSPSRLTVDTRDGIRVSGAVHLLGEGEMTLADVA